jgi:hypothetical protein
MIQSIGAQIALVAFAAAIFAGLCAGNSPGTVLIRALTALVVALFVGQGVAWAIKLVLRDHLCKRKLAIDREHLATLQNTDTEDAERTTAPPETGQEHHATQ